MFTQLSENIWCVEQQLKFFKLEFGARMTIIRLSDGTLFLHSPIEIDDALASEIEALGCVNYIVSPNKLHHFYLAAAKVRWPEATLYASPGLVEKRKDIQFDEVLVEGGNYPWLDEIHHTIFRGSRFMEEVVFCHQASGTLLLADLLMNFTQRASPGIRLLTRVVGMFGKPAMPPDWKFSVTEKAVARRCCQHILSWDWDTMVVSHGEFVTCDARTKFKSALSKFLTFERD